MARGTVVSWESGGDWAFSLKHCAFPYQATHAFPTNGGTYQCIGISAIPGTLFVKTRAMDADDR